MRRSAASKRRGGTACAASVLATLATLQGLCLAQSPAARPPAPVEVTNFPATQAVEGTVQVSNFPAERNVRLQNAVITVATQPPPRFQLVGFTSTSVDGSRGVLEFARLCQEDFPNSRMCTSEEILNTVQLPALPADTYAFVRPVIRGAYARALRDDETGLVYTQNQPYDSAGVSPISTDTVVEEMTCHGWHRGSSTHFGLAVDSKGRFDILDCRAKPIACCGLVE